MRRLVSILTLLCFLVTGEVGNYSAFAGDIAICPVAYSAEGGLILPAPGVMVNLSPSYEPVIIKGLTVHKDNPFLFDFIVDVGQDKMSGEPLKKEGEKLIKYFLASLAIPDKDVWVNLSPYEKNRIIPEALGQTDMGRDLLEQDYILKQITASLIYPEKKLGKTFWDKVYSKAQEMYGTTQVPVNTFNKVWIMADRAEVFEHNQTAFVVDSHLKVMLEEDYLALTKHQGQHTSHSIASNIIKQIILPELEKEVNQGQNFANLRQIFNSIILASWYKRSLKEALLNQVYANKDKVKGINLNDPTVKERIYEQYLKAYKKGVFNYIKEDINASNGETMPRKYFSGGVEIGAASPGRLAVITDRLKGAIAMLKDMAKNHWENRIINFLTFANTTPIQVDASMTAAAEENPPIINEVLDRLSSNISKEVGVEEAQRIIAELKKGYIFFSSKELEQRIERLRTILRRLYSQSAQKLNSPESALSNLLVGVLSTIATISSSLIPQNKPFYAIAWRDVSEVTVEKTATMPKCFSFRYHGDAQWPISLTVPTAFSQDSSISNFESEDRLFVERLSFIYHLPTYLLMLAKNDPRALAQIEFPKGFRIQKEREIYKRMYGFTWSIAEHYGLVSAPKAERYQSAEALSAWIKNNILWPATVQVDQINILGNWYTRHRVPDWLVTFLAVASEPAIRGKDGPDEISNAAESALIRIYSSLKSGMNQEGMTEHIADLSWDERRASDPAYFSDLSQRLHSVHEFGDELEGNSFFIDEAMISTEEKEENRKYRVLIVGNDPSTADEFHEKMGFQVTQITPEALEGMKDEEDKAGILGNGKFVFVFLAKIDPEQAKIIRVDLIKKEIAQSEQILLYSKRDYRLHTWNWRDGVWQFAGNFYEAFDKGGVYHSFLKAYSRLHQYQKSLERTMEVLIVEDDPDAVFMLRRIRKLYPKLKLKVEYATNRADATSKLNDPQYNFGLVITDNKFPPTEEDNPKIDEGLGFAKEVVSKGIPVILTSTAFVDLENSSPGIVFCQKAFIEELYTLILKTLPDTAMRAGKRANSSTVAMGISEQKIEDWQRILGIDKSSLMQIITRAPGIAAASVEDNLKPKRDLLVQLGTQPEDMVNGLIYLYPFNIRLLQLIHEVALELPLSDKDGISREFLGKIYADVNKRVRRFKGNQSAVYWIGLNEKNIAILRPLVKEVLEKRSEIKALPLVGKARVTTAVAKDRVMKVEMYLVRKGRAIYIVRSKKRLSTSKESDRSMTVDDVDKQLAATFTTALGALANYSRASEAVRRLTRGSDTVHDRIALSQAESALIENLINQSEDPEQIVRVMLDLAGRDASDYYVSEEYRERLRGKVGDALKLKRGDKAAFAEVYGGIDLTASGMHWKVRREGHGVEMNVDAALMARVRHDGVDSLWPEVLKMIPVDNVWPLVGLKAPDIR